jgi:thioesterase domain-containing protein
MAKIYTVAHLPDDLVQAWHQHLRNFDTQHPGCHFEVMSEFEQATVSEMMDALEVDPKIPLRWFRRKQ